MSWNGRFPGPGRNRSGIYYSLITSAYKVGSSLALGVGYLILGQWAGFHPNEENSPEAIHGLLLVFCLLPGTLYLLAAFCRIALPVHAGHAAGGRQIASTPRGPEIMD